MRPCTSNRIINHFKGTCSPNFICSQHCALYIFPVLCYITGGGRSHDTDYPSRRWSINFSHGKSWPQLGITIRFIIHHLPTLLVSKQGEQWERGLELMSRQIGARVLKCSQLEEETFGSRYRVSQSHIWSWGGAGASLNHGDTPSRFCHSSPQQLPCQKNLSWGKMFFCHSPAVKAYSCGQMPERGLTRYGFLLYIVPCRPPPPQQAFRVFVMICQITQKSGVTTFRCVEQRQRHCLQQYQLPQCDLSVSPYGPKHVVQGCLLYLYILFIQDHVCTLSVSKAGVPKFFPLEGCVWDLIGGPIKQHIFFSLETSGGPIEPYDGQTLTHFELVWSKGSTLFRYPVLLLFSGLYLGFSCMSGCRLWLHAKNKVYFTHLNFLIMYLFRYPFNYFVSIHEDVKNLDLITKPFFESQIWRSIM